MIPKPFFDAQTRNFTIQHGIERGRGGLRPPHADERRLGTFLLPPFQRGEVWTIAQKVRFIESIWLKLPIASYVVNYDDQHDLGYPCDQWLLDGQQRWVAIGNYVGGKLRVFDLTWSELTDAQQLKFINHPFPSIETHNLTIEECREVYERLAYGGTAHA